MKTILALLILPPVIALGQCEVIPSASDQWPPKPVLDISARITACKTEYSRQGADWRKHTEWGAYQPTGNYLNWSGSVWSPRTWPNVSFDTNGVIQQSFDGNQTYVYQPTLISQDMLWMHSAWMDGAPLAPEFWVSAQKLIEMQNPDGGIPFPFALPSFGLPHGWVSGLAQGQAASALLRAYAVSGHLTAYGDAARRAIEFMLRPVSQGGCLGNLQDLHPSLGNYAMIQEYPYPVDSYTLNGTLFALLGLYDWSFYDPSILCTLKELAETVGHILPYYDMHGWSSYNLQHLSQGKSAELQPIYHSYNTMLVWAVDSFLPSQSYNRTWRTWAGYVNQPLP